MFGKFKSTIKTTIHKRRWFNSQYQHKLRAESLLKNIELEKGNLKPKYKKLAVEYAQDVLGWVGFAPWLITYSAMAGEFKEGWIPDNYYEEVVYPGSSITSISREKSLSSKLMNTDCFPDIAYFVDGLFFTRAWVALSPMDVKRYIFDQNDKIVYKQNNSGGGMGIHTITAETFNLETIHRMGNGVFQMFIQQHKFFEEIMPDSVATLRLNSVVKSTGEISCRSAYLKIGRNNEPYVMPSSHIVIPVDLTSGELYEKGYNHNWCSVSQHPDTNVVFKRKVMPKFKECVACITKTHQSVPFCRVIGWDLTVDKDEDIQFMEWERPYTAFAEATQGPCFADIGWEKLRPARVFNYII